MVLSIYAAVHNTGQYSHVGWLVYLLANLNKSNNANARHVNDFLNAINHSGKKKSASIVMASIVEKIIPMLKN